MYAYPNISISFLKQTTLTFYSQLDHAIRLAKQDKVSTKRDIKKWMTQFEKDNGLPPDTRAKESVKHLYLAHHKAIGVLEKAEGAMLVYLQATRD